MKAIETRYRNHRFRSRLEARWAVFFDALGLEWRYEPEGFEVAIERPGQEVDIERYLPDFYLPRLGMWFEVKPEGTGLDEVHHAFAAALPAGQRFVLAAGGHPSADELDGTGHPYASAFDLMVPGDQHYAWCTCPWCGKPGVEFDARGARVCGFKAHYEDEGAALAAIAHLGHWRADDKCYTGNAPLIKAGYAAARAARFEHGESGAG